MSRLERVLVVLFRSFSYTYATCTSAFAEASVSYAATDTCLVNAQPLIFLLNLHFSISQVYVACGDGGSCKFVATATAKVEIQRGHNVVLRFLRLYH